MDAWSCPLFVPRAVAWTPPGPEAFDAILLTSANGVRLAGPAIATYAALPAYAVGAATAAALRAAGFAQVIAGTGDGSAIAARIGADGHRRVLHLAGRTVAPILADTLALTRITVYAMETAPPDPALAQAAQPGAVMLVHSARAGTRLAELIPAPMRGALHLVAISAAARDAAGDGWASAHAAQRPADDEMLALALRLCQGQAQ